jgi:predicted ATPase
MTELKARKETWQEAELHALAGDFTLMAARPDAAKAQAHYEDALAVARAQQAKSWELQAATRLARLWRDQGRRREARDLLAPVHGWFTEGFSTRDLQEAKALLTQLGR